ncbi:MAG: hypothetical protein ABI477_16405 [Chryseolinea sp.]
MNTLKLIVSFISNLFKAIWVFLAATLSVVIMYVLFINIEQGIDVVIQLGEYPARGILAVVTIVLWSYILWYSSRTLSYVRQDRDDRVYLENYQRYSIPTGFYQHVPRLLGYHCFVCIQIAIFNLPTIFAWNMWIVLAAIVLHTSLYALIHVCFLTKDLRKKRISAALSIMAIISYGGFLIVSSIQKLGALKMTVFSDDSSRHVFWLRLIALVLFACQLVAVYWFIKRRQNVDTELAKHGNDLEYYTKDSKSVLKEESIKSWLTHPRFSVVEKKYVAWFNIVCALAGVIYLFVVFVIRFSNFMGPLAVAVLAFGVLAGLANFIQVLSIRLGFSVFFILYVIAFIIGYIAHDPYEVRLVEDGSQKHFANRPSPRQYLAKWFDQRLQKVKDMRGTYDTAKHPYDVYIVLSNGGASRAGKWTSSVLSNLQDVSRQRNPNDKFGDHIMAIAGASGGTVGNCAFYSMLKAEVDDDPLLTDKGDYSTHTNNFFASDFLTFTLGRLLGPDLVRHIFPINMDDRAAALESLLSRSKDPLLNKYFAANITDVFDYSGKLPILYITSTKVDDGMPGVISSVQLSKDSKRGDILNIIDNYTPNGRQFDLKLRTAAILSSRFPYVSPAGRINNNYYVDGGYFDNAGAGTTLELLAELKNLFLDSVKYQKHFAFHILHNTNSEQSAKPSKPIRPLTNDLLAPLLTLAGMQGASTSISTSTLGSDFILFSKDTIGSLIEFSLYRNTMELADTSLYASDTTRIDTTKYEEGYPMSWVISDYQLSRMNKALKLANFENMRHLYFYDRKVDAILPEELVRETKNKQK